MGYTTKKNFWGTKSYYDDKGHLIGKEDTTWFGNKVIKDADGNVVGRPKKDLWGRETIVMEKRSFFGTTKSTLLKEGELEDWEMCENCGDYLDGDSDIYCNECEHDHW